jgi:ABC-type uncharacterized transport system substrate-binding protein
MDWRSAEGKADRLPALAAELVRLQVEVIVAPGNPVVLAAKKATTTIPIVMPFAVVPVETGLVASLARPGGNVTGLTFDVSTEINGKRLEILTWIIPER